MKHKLVEDATPKTPPTIKQPHSVESVSLDNASDVGGSDEPAIASNLPHIQLHNELRPPPRLLPRLRHTV